MINFTNSLGGNCNFVYLKKFKEEVECFLQNQKIDNSNDAVEDFFLLSFSNKKSLQWLEGKFLTASTPSKIYANKNKIKKIADLICSLSDDLIASQLSELKAKLECSMKYRFSIDGILLSRELVFQSTLREFVEWSKKYKINFSTSKGVISENNIFYLFVKACDFIGFKNEWFSVQAHSLDRFLRPRLHELKKNNAELLGGVLLRDVFYVLAGLKSGGRVVFN